MAVSKPVAVGPIEAPEGKKLSGAQILCECLLKEGVEVIFGIPGGATLPLYHALYEYPIRHILVRHEQGAAHAADGYARATGRPGVCFATSGPGATNLTSGIANACLDSSPVVAITGQVATPLIGKDAFQEVDITGITQPITKHNYLVTRVEDLAPVVKEAFYLATTGRPGPVLIDIPRDVQTAKTNFGYPKGIRLPGYKPTLLGHQRQIRQAAALIGEAERPVILAGHGVIISGAFADLRELAEKGDIPVITTLLGISSFPESHRLSFGMLGMHGSVYANTAVNESDLLIAIGMRFDDRATGKTSHFAPKARVIHIDIDPAEIGKNVRVDVPIVGDVKNVLMSLNKEIALAKHTEWVEQINRWREQFPLTIDTETDVLLPQYVVQQIYGVTEGKATIVTDVGQNQMWAAQYYCYDRPNSFISSGGLGTMGFSLPAAMGAKVGRPDELIWAIAGDGGFQMNIQELATVVQDKIPVKVAILNNGYLGMIRQWQQLFFERRYLGSPLSGPDFARVAEAYGAAGFRVTTKEEVRPTLIKAMEYDGPAIVDFWVAREENVYPMIPPGAAAIEMIHGPQK
ncbi:MAG: biosynthetic-type acetolactate synthase large subunit [Chloroflexi bacterium]|nr:biosynthetic-type acetolactate synthase large subunit [Chloroflexota bacterium]